MDFSFPMPLLLPFNCTDGAIRGSPAWCLFTRELCKTKTVMVKTLLVNSVYLHGRPQKKKKTQQSILKYPHGMVLMEVVS